MTLKQSREFAEKLGKQLNIADVFKLRKNKNQSHKSQKTWDGIIEKLNKIAAKKNIPLQAGPKEITMSLDQLRRRMHIFVTPIMSAQQIFDLVKTKGPIRSKDAWQQAYDELLAKQNKIRANGGTFTISLNGNKKQVIRDDIVAIPLLPWIHDYAISYKIFMQKDQEPIAPGESITYTGHIERNNNQEQFYNGFDPNDDTPINPNLYQNKIYNVNPVTGISEKVNDIQSELNSALRGETYPFIPQYIEIHFEPIPNHPIGLARGFTDLTNENYNCLLSLLRNWAETQSDKEVLIKSLDKLNETMFKSGVGSEEIIIICKKLRISISQWTLANKLWFSYQYSEKKKTFNFLLHDNHVTLYKPYKEEKEIPGQTVIIKKIEYHHNVHQQFHDDETPIKYVVMENQFVTCYWTDEGIIYKNKDIFFDDEDFKENSQNLKYAKCTTMISRCTKDIIEREDIQMHYNDAKLFKYVKAACTQTPTFCTTQDYQNHYEYDMIRQYISYPNLPLYKDLGLPLMPTIFHEVIIPQRFELTEKGAPEQSDWEKAQNLVIKLERKEYAEERSKYEIIKQNLINKTGFCTITNIFVPANLVLLHKIQALRENTPYPNCKLKFWLSKGCTFDIATTAYSHEKQFFKFDISLTFKQELDIVNFTSKYLEQQLLLTESQITNKLSTCVQKYKKNLENSVIGALTPKDKCKRQFKGVIYTKCELEFHQIRHQLGHRLISANAETGFIHYSLPDLDKRESTKGAVHLRSYILGYADIAFWESVLSVNFNNISKIKVDAVIVKKKIVLKQNSKFFKPLQWHHNGPVAKKPAKFDTQLLQDLKFENAFTKAEMKEFKLSPLPIEGDIYNHQYNIISGGGGNGKSTFVRSLKLYNEHWVFPDNAKIAESSKNFPYLKDISHTLNTYCGIGTKNDPQYIQNLNNKLDEAKKAVHKIDIEIDDIKIEKEYLDDEKNDDQDRKDRKKKMREANDIRNGILRKKRVVIKAEIKADRDEIIEQNELRQGDCDCCNIQYYKSTIVPTAGTIVLEEMSSVCKGIMNAILSSPALKHRNVIIIHSPSQMGPIFPRSSNWSKDKSPYFTGGREYQARTWNKIKRTVNFRCKSVKLLEIIDYLEDEDNEQRLWSQDKYSAFIKVAIDNLKLLGCVYPTAKAIENFTFNGSTAMLICSTKDERDKFNKILHEKAKLLPVIDGKGHYKIKLDDPIGPLPKNTRINDAVKIGKNQSLAYSVTCHFSQGATVHDNILISINNMFERHHLYTCITRAVNHEQIFIMED
jgi:hypothetical protein